MRTELLLVEAALLLPVAEVFHEAGEALIRTSNWALVTSNVFLIRFEVGHGGGSTLGSPLPG